MVDGAAADGDAAAGVEWTAGRALAGAGGGADAQELAWGECAGKCFFGGDVDVGRLRAHHPFACTN